MDLDNLLKRLLDALGKTVLREAPGGDSAIVRLSGPEASGWSERGTRRWIALRDAGPVPW